jgi:hypothetical protein
LVHLLFSVCLFDEKDPNYWVWIFA